MLPVHQHPDTHPLLALSPLQSPLEGQRNYSGTFLKKVQVSIL